MKLKSSLIVYLYLNSRLSMSSSIVGEGLVAAAIITLVGWSFNLLAALTGDLKRSCANDHS